MEFVDALPSAWNFSLYLLTEMGRFLIITMIVNTLDLNEQLRVLLSVSVTSLCNEAAFM